MLWLRPIFGPWKVTVCAVLSIGGGTASAHDATPNLQIETTAELRNGEAFGPADRVRVGDEILYTLRVRNANDSAVPEAVIVKQVPRNTRYVARSAVGPAAALTYSTDGGRTFAAADNVIVTLPDGTTRPAVADDYTHIRWQLRHPLPAGATALLRFRCVLR